MGFDVVTMGLQFVIGVLFGAILLRYAAKFRWSLYRFASGHLGLALILVLLYALVYAQLGTGLGIQYLFWHEDFPVRVSAAFGATLLLGVLGVIAFYLDPYPWATEHRTQAWLRVDEYEKRKLASWWSRRVNTPMVRQPWWRSIAGSATRSARGRPVPSPSRPTRPSPSSRRRRSWRSRSSGCITWRST